MTRMRTKKMTWMLMLSVLVALGGCAEDSGESYGPPSYSGESSDGRSITTGDGSGGSGGASTGASSVPAEGCGEGCEGIEDVPAGQLTAGEWRDLDDWELWLELMSGDAWSDKQPHWGYETTLRVPVRVTTGGEKVVDATVTLSDGSGTEVWRARTDSQGRAELFASAFAEDAGPYAVTVTSGSATETVSDVDPAVFEELEIDLASAAEHGTRNLDLMFVIDTTGSMGDELWYIQAELEDVISRAQADAEQRFDLRLSMNFYRDEGDFYVVRSHPFTTDVSEGLSHLAAEGASGGGDFPEAVDQAVADAIDGHEWSETATARLLFLVLDAPPHHEDAILERLRDANRAAAARGVKIIPVAGSGIDKDTEFLMRFLAVTTGGTYTFLTNHSGIGGDHIEPSIGPYKVWLLNDLLVDIITDEISPGTAD
jgi:hypothetical protein